MLSLSFEVKETDLLGRVGTLKAGGKAIETPCLVPVVHPVSQAVSAGELKAMGFGGLMTNSFIILSRRREEALREGLHRTLGFEGLVMTDSGGYQVLEYGDLGVGYREVAEFQAGIGSDVAVTLDRPTGYPQTRRSAEDSVRYSLRNARATLREFGGRETAWVGPIQGGLYLDLVARSASSLSRAGFEILALGSPVQVMENYMFADLVRMIVAARKAIPYSTPLHLFGAGHPLTIPLTVALGCDTFDSASYILFARSGRYMTHGAVLTLQSMRYLPCSCGVCAKSSVRELMEMGHAERTKLLAVHNLYMLREGVEACKEAISEGRLWDLVEEGSLAHPRLREAFIEFAKHGDVLLPGTPLTKDRGLMLRSEHDLSRPEVQMAKARLRAVIKPSASEAVLLGAWGRRPAVRRRARAPRGGRADAYRMHPAIGAYPAELDFVYPFMQSVTGDWLAKAAPRDDAARQLRALGYKRVRIQRSRSPPKARVRSRRSPRVASPSPRSS